MLTARTTALALAAILSPSLALGAGAIGCAADLDDNLTIDSGDLNILLADFGAAGAGLAADIDADLDVDSADLNLLLADFGACAFDYGPSFADAEARQIGYEFIGASGPLVLPTDIYDRVVTDLQAIRAVAPALQDQTHTPAWSAVNLIVAIPDDIGLAAIQNHNNYFNVTGVDDLFSFSGQTFWLITFPQPVNIAALAQLYAGIPGVNSAEPDGLIGGQNFYSPEQFPGDTWLWFIDDGFHDCFDGCDCHFFYEFETDGKGNATLIDQSQSGAPWCPWPI